MDHNFYAQNPTPGMASQNFAGIRQNIMRNILARQSRGDPRYAHVTDQNISQYVDIELQDCLDGLVAQVQAQAQNPSSIVYNAQAALNHNMGRTTTPAVQQQQHSSLFAPMTAVDQPQQHSVSSSAPMTPVDQPQQHSVQRNTSPAIPQTSSRPTTRVVYRDERPSANPYAMPVGQFAASSVIAPGSLLPARQPLRMKYPPQAVPLSLRPSPQPTPTPQTTTAPAQPARSLENQRPQRPIRADPPLQQPTASSEQVKKFSMVDPYLSRLNSQRS